MKLLLSILLLTCFSISFSQERGIVLKEKTSEKNTFLPENKRIKIKTKDGKVFVGKFVIIDNNSIKIDNNMVLLDSVFKIKRRSLTSAIGSPIVIVTGSLLLSAGIAGAVIGGYGYLATITLVPASIPMLLIPLISNNHKPDKWEYSIGVNPNNKRY